MRTIAALLFSTLLLGCNEADVKVYGSSDEARADGAIARGWIPQSLPKSSKAIREKHDLDTNESWGRFEFAAPDAATFAATLTRITTSGTCLRDPRVEWWPASTLSSLEKYQANDDKRVFFAIDWKNNVGFFWRCAT